VELTGLIEKHRDQLSPAERRVADVVLRDPESVAFGTVATVARQAATSGASVVRLASRLGLDGFSALQAMVQGQLSRQLRPATERIRQPGPADVVGQVLAAELDNVHATLDRVDRADFDGAVAALATSGGRVLLASGDASAGVLAQFGAELSMLRDGVELLDGTEVAVSRRAATVGADDVAVVLDLRRYDRAVMALARRMAAAGATVVALTDRTLSPLAAVADTTFVVTATGVGPFDSYVGALALLNAITAAVAARLRSSATERLDRIEAAWTAIGALVDD
jgi:DNA-binding MurR/RpiR family transcriptional regulator